MGVEKQVIRPGTGPRPAPGQTVTVHCTGFGKNGDLSRKFWSTKDPDQEPFTFQIGKGSVIKEVLLAYHCLTRPKRSGSRVKLSGGKYYLGGDYSVYTGVGFENSQGWDEGVLGMQIGEVARLRCSPDYAYGSSGFPAWGIQPNSVLDFEIEVLSLK